MPSEFGPRTWFVSAPTPIACQSNTARRHLLGGSEDFSSPRAGVVNGVFVSCEIVGPREDGVLRHKFSDDCHDSFMRLQAVPRKMNNA